MNVKYARNHRGKREHDENVQIHIILVVPKGWEGMHRSNIWWNNSWLSSRNDWRTIDNWGSTGSRCKYRSIIIRIYLQWCVFQTYKRQSIMNSSGTWYSLQLLPSTFSVWLATEAETLTTISCYLSLSFVTLYPFHIGTNYS